MSRRIHVVVNPVAGPGLGPTLVDSHIKPLLVSAFGPDAVSIHEGDAPSRLADLDRTLVIDKLLKERSKHGTLDVVLVGGDGTTHGMLTQLYLPRQAKGEESPAEAGLPEVRLALVPAGTANALYSAMYPQEWTQERQQKAASASKVDEIPEDVVQVMLKSVQALVDAVRGNGHDRLFRLPLMLDEMHHDNEGERLTISHLVTSHGLHAAILHDADTPEMRAQHKGIERFKMAAQMNATKWIHGELILHSDTGSPRRVERYSPLTRQFESVSAEEVKLEGPFLYLNAMVTDRLESAFVPSPLSSGFTSPGLPQGAVDLVVIRPRRDPPLATCTSDEAETGVQFATTRLGPITAAMYDGGKHIDLIYSSGEGKQERQEPMVEYLRCSAYEFVAAAKGDKDKSRLVCTDGHVDSVDRVWVSRWGSQLGKQKRAQAAQSGVLRNMDAPLIWR